MADDPEPKPRPPRSARILAILVALYVAGLLAAWVMLNVLSDVWWPATVLLFSPRWPFALPLAVLVPAAIRLDRRLLAPLGVAALVVVFPVMGFCFSFRGAYRAAFPGEKSAETLRVMTYNIGGGTADERTFERFFADNDPDIIAMQECANKLDPDRLKRRGWYLRIDGGQCFLSRFPIRRAEARDPRDVWAMGGSGAMVHYELETPNGIVNVVNVHLETVRDGLTALRYNRLRGVPALEKNTNQRRLESKLAREFAARVTGPLIVLGDFNMPAESEIYRSNWWQFQNAFEQAGFGFGRSKYTHWHGVRIDHVLASSAWTCERTWVAEGASPTFDHRPMIAELRLTRRE